MKKFKSLLSVILVLLLMLTFTGCLHKKGEIAVEVGETKFTAAMYSYALLNADTEARTKVDEQLAKEAEEKKEEDSAAVAPAEVDYYAQKIDDVDFVTWVENRAIEMLSEYAVYEKLYKEAGLSLSEERNKELDAYAEDLYGSYGAMFEANGIGEETYRKMLNYDAYAEEYFDFLYGKDGSKAVLAEEINKYFGENYRVAFVLQSEAITNLEEDKVAEVKEKLEHSKMHLEKGESVVEAYNEYYGLSEETEDTTGYGPAKEESEVVTILTNPAIDTQYGFPKWDEIKDVAPGKAVIVEYESNAQKYLLLVYMVNVAEDDTTYLDQMDSNIRWALKNEEYKKDMAAAAAELKVVKHSRAMSVFKVKDIDYGM